MATHQPFLRGVEPSATEAMGDTEGFLLHRWKHGLQLVHSSRWPLHVAAISNSCKESLIYGCSYEHFFFGSSVTFLICALQDTEETDCSSFHKKLRDVSLERQRALYSNAHTHTHPAARHPNTVRVSGDVNQAAGLLWESRSIITLITEQIHVFNQILVCGFQTTSAIFILFLN